MDILSLNAKNKLGNTFFISVCLLALSACQNITSHNSAMTSSVIENKISTDDFTIIAHRGASGYLPEHSKEAAVLAYMQGADYIEQDLVVSKDNHLVVLHDIHLETVTNVESVFPNRKRNDKRYYAVDFTLQELRQLSLHERQTSEQTQVFKDRYNGSAHFSITTFAEQVELVRELNRQFASQREKVVGWYPEIKSPEWHLQENKDIAALLANELNRLGLNSETSKVYVQSFEPISLRRLKNEFGLKVPLIQLIGDNDWEESSADYEAMKTRVGLSKIAEYASGIGPWLPQVYDYQTNSIKRLVSLAQQQKLIIHPYTHREDADNLPDLPKNMYFKLKKVGVDGLFTDQIMTYMVSE